MPGVAAGPLGSPEGPALEIPLEPVGWSVAPGIPGDPEAPGSGSIEAAGPPGCDGDVEDTGGWDVTGDGGFVVDPGAGWVEGRVVGPVVGCTLGPVVGCAVGALVGCTVGAVVGLDVEPAATNVTLVHTSDGA